MAQAPEPLYQESADALFQRNQVDSPLLRLPGEIRNRIFEFAFTVKRVVVDRDLLDLHHPTKVLINTVDAQEVKDGLFTILYPISTVCRQIREETVDLPFTLNALEICLEDIETLAHILPTHVRGLITELKIHTYTYLETRALYDEAAGNRRLAAVAQFLNL